MLLALVPLGVEDGDLGSTTSAVGPSSLTDPTEGSAAVAEFMSKIELVRSIAANRASVSGTVDFAS